MTPLVFALSLMVTAAPPPDDGGEPLPPSAPTDSYELSAWCYGALGEYLAVYERVKPDLRAIDRMFGTSVVEAEPYQSDMAAARQELKMIGESVTAAEKASPRPIAPHGVAAMRQGQGIWALAEGKTSRELARAWLSWALPDRCDSNARDLVKRSAILGKALTYNNGPGAVETAAASPAPAAPAPLSTQAGAEIAPPEHLTAGAIGYVGATGVSPSPAAPLSPTVAPALAAPEPAPPVTEPRPSAAIAANVAQAPTPEAAPPKAGDELAASAPVAPMMPQPQPPTPRPTASASAAPPNVDEPQEPVL